MPVAVDPAQRAARAAALRLLAARLEACGVGDLACWAGNDTWVGPTADACRAALAQQSATIDATAAALRSRARQLDLLTEPNGPY